jgi:putative ABC transport system permease protein
MTLIDYGLRTISLIVPSQLRDDWLQEWRGEFFHAWGPTAARHPGAVRAAIRCGGALIDACRLRMRTRHSPKTYFFDTTSADIRFGLRTLRKRPLFTTVAVLTIGLGIGVATAMFSVVDGVLLRSVPFREPGQLFNVWMAIEGAKGLPGLVGRTWDKLPLSLEEYRDLQAKNTVFQGVAVHNAIQTTLTGAGDAERLWIGFGSASLMTVLGVQPVLGRWFLPGEEGRATGGAAPVVVISYYTWHNRLGGDPNVLNRKLTLNGTERTIVGVLPPSFRLRYLGMHWLGEDRTGKRDVWAPLGSPGLGNGNNLEAIARLAPGVSLERALVETGNILSVNEDDADVRLVPRAFDETHGLNSPLLLLFGATGLLLLIACGNIASLSLGELHGRRFEFATRAALGAGKRRIVRQLLTESILLGLAGSVIGALIAVGLTEVLVALAPPIPRADTAGVDLRVFSFAAALGTLAGLVFGTVPSLASVRRSVSGSLRASGRTSSARRGSFERVVISSEIALTVVLLVGGGLLGRSLFRLLAVDPGFDPAGLATIHIALPQDGHDSSAKSAEAYAQITAALEAVPGVISATAATRLPFPGLTNTTTREAVRSDGTSQQISAQQVRVWPGYYETMGIPLLAGRALSESDGPDDPPVMVISENIARRYWPNESPVGAKLQGYGGNDITIVGVVGNVKRNRLGVEPDPVFYTSLRQRPAPDVRLVIRTAGEPGAFLSSMRNVVHAVDDRVPVTDLATMDDLITKSASEERYRTLLMILFGGLACLLAAVGVFGVVARAVALRTREFGIRIALGAESRGLMRRELRGSLRIGLVGTGIGLLVAVWIARLLSQFLFGVMAWDPVTYGAVALILIVVSLAASYLPARRVTRVDPVEVLRTE